MHIRGERWRNLCRFAAKNQRLLWLLLLFLIGVQIGCTVFCSATQTLGHTLRSLLSPKPLANDFGAIIAQLFAVAAPHFLLLLLLFLLGFSACGAPLSLAVPLFFGAGVGLTVAYHYATGWHGVAYVALLVLPSALAVTATLLIAAAEAVRFSSQLARQMLPHPSIGGGLWPDLKLYLARFLLCAGLLFTAAVLDTVLRTLFLHYFV